MTIPLVVAFTVSGWRPAYLRRALESWARVRGVREARLLFMIEPGGTSFDYAAFRAYAGRVFGEANVVAAVNETRLGCLANTRAALRLSFAAGSDFVVLAEEDVEVSPDVLEYFSFARRLDPPGVAAVCSHVFKAPAQAESFGTIQLPWFSPLVWGTWRDRWEKFIEPAWGPVEGNSQGWDLNLRQRIQGAGYRSLFPCVSRSRHIGERSTVTPPPLSENFYRSSLTECFAGDLPAGDWREISVPGDLVV